MVTTSVTYSTMQVLQNWMRKTISLNKELKFLLLQFFKLIKMDFIFLFFFNPLHPNISMYILHTVFYTSLRC